MTNQELKEEAKKKLLDYLSLKGINYKNNFTCLNPQHQDKHPSMSYDSKRNKVHCFACGADYDIFDLVSLDTGLSGKELFEKVYDMFDLKKDIFYVAKTNKETEEKLDLQDLFEKCHSAVEETNYWKERGLSKKTIDKFNIGFWKEKNRLIIPTGKNSYNARAIGEVEKKYRYLKPKGEYIPFNMESLKSAEEPVFVVEGEFDALSIIEAGSNAVALGSCGSSKFIEYVKNNKPSYPLILSMDNDSAGQDGEEKLQEELLNAGIYSIRVNVSCGYKDANEALQKEKRLFIKAVENAKNQAITYRDEEKQKEIDKYNRESAAFELNTFIENIKENKGSCFSTGFNSLDTALDGGFYPGLYIMGAVSSLGKTTLALQSCDAIAARGQDVLIFSLEMAKKELIAKSLSRLSYQRCKSLGSDLTYAATTRSLLNGAAFKSDNQSEFLKDVLKSYTFSARHIFYQIGMGDIGINQIRKAVEAHIAITGNKPMVVVDYLQIIAPFDMRAGDKQNVDKAVVELKRISRDFDIPVLVVSSFNRESYTSPVNISSFKESGAIEYTSDVLMALQPKGMDYEKKDDGKYEDEKTRNNRILHIKEELENNADIPGGAQRLELKILKNRNGRRGSVDLNFYPMFNTFEEIKKQKTSGDGWVLKSVRRQRDRVKVI